MSGEEEGGGAQTRGARAAPVRGAGARRVRARTAPVGGAGGNDARTRKKVAYLVSEMTCATRALLPTFVAQQYSGGPQRTFRSLQAANAHVAEGRQLRIDRVAEGKTQITRGWLDIEGDPLDSCPVATKNLVFCDMLENCLNAVGAGCFAYAAFGHPLIWQTDPVKGTMCEAALRRKLTSQGFKVKDAPNDGSDRKTDGTRLGKTSLAFDFQMKRGCDIVKPVRFTS